jgi:hypothetical protein
MDGGAPAGRLGGMARLPGLGEQSAAPGSDTDSVGDWLERLEAALRALSPDAHRIADAALRAAPGNATLLLLAAVAALVVGQPDRAMGYLKRFERKYERDKAVTLLTALTLARQGHTARAWSLLEQNGLLDPYAAAAWFIGGQGMAGWLAEQMAALRKAHGQAQRAARLASKPVRPAPRAAPPAAAKRASAPVVAEPAPPPSISPSSCPTPTPFSLAAPPTRCGSSCAAR